MHLWKEALGAGPEHGHEGSKTRHSCQRGNRPSVVLLNCTLRCAAQSVPHHFCEWLYVVLLLIIVHFFKSFSKYYAFVKKCLVHGICGAFLLPT